MMRKLFMYGLLVVHDEAQRGRPETLCRTWCIVVIRFITSSLVFVAFRCLCVLVGVGVGVGDAQVRYSCKCSFFEIFNEKVFDLVDESNRDNPMGLTVREDTRKGVYVEGLMEEDVSWVWLLWLQLWGSRSRERWQGANNVTEREVLEEAS